MITNAEIKPLENKVSKFGVLTSENIDSSEWKSDLHYRLNGFGVERKLSNRKNR